MTQLVIFDGSFDPFTKGHAHVVREAINMGFEPIVLVANNPSKKYMWDLNTRVKMTEVAVRSEFGDQVSVQPCNNQYVAVWAKEHGVKYRIRGIRNPNDFLDEYNISHNNETVFGELKSLFVIPPLHLASISSSFVKGIRGFIGWQWKMQEFVNREIADKMVEEWVIDQILQECVPISRVIVEKMVHLQRPSSTRFYHTTYHLAHIISHLQSVSCFSKYTAMATLCHDLVYDVSRNDNEIMSIETARMWSSEFNFSVVADMVLQPNQTVFNDADMAILASDYEKVYKPIYLNGVFAEYRKAFDHNTIVDGRIKFLTNLLSRDKIFNTPQFALLEWPARQNMQRELEMHKEI